LRRIVKTVSKGLTIAHMTLIFDPSQRAQKRLMNV